MAIYLRTVDLIRGEKQSFLDVMRETVGVRERERKRDGEREKEREGEREGRMNYTNLSTANLVVLCLPPQLHNLLIPRLSMEASGLVGAGSDDGRLLRRQPDEGHELAVDILVVRERPEALAVLGAVLTPEKERTC